MILLCFHGIFKGFTVRVQTNEEIPDRTNTQGIKITEENVLPL